MRGFLNSPVKSSIIVYVIFVLIYLLFFQKFYKEEIKSKKYVLPLLVITLSILIFYIFKLLQLHFT